MGALSRLNGKKGLIVVTLLMTAMLVGAWSVNQCVYTWDVSYRINPLTSFEEIEVPKTTGATKGWTMWGSFLPPKADLVFVFDLTGSMAWVTEAVKDQAVKIMEDLNVAIEDIAFGVGSFTDYPRYYESLDDYKAWYGGEDDYAWRQGLDITKDKDLVAFTIEGLENGWGADMPQDYTRAVWETQFFSWREDAVRLVVLFGDAPAHSYPSGAALFLGTYGGDPGRDEIMGTFDDLDYVPVIEEIADMGIIFLTVDCQPGTGGMAEDAHRNLRYIAEETGGACLPLEAAGNIPEVIISLLLEVFPIEYVETTHVDKKLELFFKVTEEDTEALELNYCNLWFSVFIFGPGPDEELGTWDDELVGEVWLALVLDCVCQGQVEGSIILDSGHYGVIKNVEYFTRPVTTEVSGSFTVCIWAEELPPMPHFA